MKIVVFFIAYLLFGLKAFAAAGIAVKLESDVMYQGVIQGLEIRAWGLEEDLDYSALYKQFEVVDETFGRAYRVIDGKAQQIQIWQLNVRPQEIGNFKLPVLEQEGVRSEGYEYQVKAKPNTQWQPENGALRSYWRIENDSPYVQQGTLITLVIEHQYPVSHLKIDWPKFTGLRAINRGEARYLRTGSTSTIEKSWYVIGEASEVYEQASVEYEVQLNRSRIKYAIVKQKTPPMQLNIRALPQEYRAPWVLVADDVTIEESWSQPVNRMLVGQQRTRTIMVRAKGALADQIPDIEMPQSRGVDIEPMRPFSRTTRWINDTPVATAKFSYLISAKSPIPVFFDNIRLAWFSVVENRQKHSLVYAIRADIANPDRSTLLEEAPIKKVPIWHSIIFGLTASAFLVFSGSLLSGNPKGYVRLWSVIRLKMAGSDAAKLYQALEYWCAIWRVPLEELSTRDSPAKAWFSAFNNQIYAKQNDSQVIGVPAVAMDRWMMSKRT